MACAVYCLVPRDGQLGPLMDRLRHAGVPARDITVVVRADSPAGQAGIAFHWAPSLWVLAPTVLWWSAALYGWAALTPPAARKRDPAVVSLASYRRRHCR